MSKHEHHPVAQTAAIIAGAATTAQSRVNGQLAVELGSGWQAALVSFSVGLILLVVTAIVWSPVRLGLLRVYRAVASSELKWWQVIGGTAGAGFVAVQSLSVPLVGVGIFTIATVGSQTAASLLVDRIGIGPQGVIHPSRNRIVAAALAIIAVAVAVADRLDHSDFPLWAVIAALAVGAAVGFQHALNGQVSRVAQHPVTAALNNFIFGTALLVLIWTGLWLSGVAKWHALPAGPWWLYLGGFLGLWFIVTAAIVIKRLGSLRFALGSISGQLIGAVAFDVFAPTAGVSISAYLITGVCITALAVLLANYRKGQSR